MKKITFLALHLGYGGIEKCICDVANLLCNDYEVEILSIYKLYDKEVFELNKNVKIKYLTNMKPNKKEFIDSVKHLKIFTTFKEGVKALNILRLKKRVTINAIKKIDSDIIISTRIFTNKLLGKYGKGKLIGWEHNHHHGNLKYQKEFMKSCQRLNSVILVSESLKLTYEKIFNDNNIKCKCIYIPNFIDSNDTNLSNLDTNNLISVGRLSPEKGYDDLIDVFKLIKDQKEDVHLNIIGDGQEYNKLQKKIKKLNLSNYITLHGYQNHEYINKLYHLSSIYLMSSYTESFGLVLIEAMSKKLVPIAFNSAEGACDIINNNENGYLINNRDKNEMANKVIELLNDRKKLVEFSKNAYFTSKKYDKQNTKNCWIKLLEE